MRVKIFLALCFTIFVCLIFMFYKLIDHFASNKFSKRTFEIEPIDETQSPFYDDLVYNEHEPYYKTMENRIKKLEYVDIPEKGTIYYDRNVQLDIYAYFYISKWYKSIDIQKFMDNLTWVQYISSENADLSLYLMRYNMPNDLYKTPIYEYNKLFRDYTPGLDFPVKEGEIFMNEKFQYQIGYFEAVPSDAIFLLYNRPVFLYTIGLGDSKVYDIESALPHYLLLIEQKIRIKCNEIQKKLGDIPFGVLRTTLFEIFSAVDENIYSDSEIEFDYEDDEILRTKINELNAFDIIFSLIEKEDGNYKYKFYLMIKE